MVKTDSQYTLIICQSSVILLPLLIMIANSMSFKPSNESILTVSDLLYLPRTINIKSLRKISPHVSDKLVSAVKHQYIFPDYSFRILSSRNATNVRDLTYFRWVVEQKSTVITMKNVFVDYYGVYDDSYKFDSPYADHHDYGEYEVSGQVYDNVIYLRLSFPEYGHQMYDGVLPNILTLPADIVRTAAVASTFNQDLSRKFIDALGIEHGPYIIMEPKKSYFCKRIHFIEPGDAMCSQIYFIRKIRDLIAKNYKTERIKPEIGMLNNRDKNPRGRHVLNFDDFIEAVKQKYPETTWINIKGKEMEDLSYSVKMFAATKYFIAVAGSGPQNAILMKPGTGITIIGVEDLDWGPCAVAASLNIWTAYAANRGFIHYPRRKEEMEYTMYIPYNMKFVERMVYAVANQRWPPLEHDCTLLWDLKAIARRYDIKAFPEQNQENQN